MFFKTVNDNASRMFCAEIRLLSQKQCTQGFIISIFLIVQTPAKFGNPQI